jgi:acetyl-CoA carboxylase carboxyl transferase subunit alpha
MNLDYLDFEQPIAELEAKIRELKNITEESDIDIVEEVERLQKKSNELTKRIYASLSTSQVVQVARHPLRPHASDYISRMFTDFDELLGDRHFGAGRALIGGTARLDGQPVMVIGHEKGRQTADKIKRNFGMPQPEGYRKALRLMQMAEKFNMPLFMLIDTMGAYPGIGAEERNQSEAIAKNLYTLAGLRVPVICVVTGEGGSGGALAIGVGDRVYMLENSTFSVISPEGCASILWKDAKYASQAAEAMGVTAKDVNKAGLIDGILSEPLGGAHRNPDQMAETLKKKLLSELSELRTMSMEDLLKSRYERLMGYGVAE